MKITEHKSFLLFIYKHQWKWCVINGISTLETELFQLLSGFFFCQQTSNTNLQIWSWIIPIQNSLYMSGPIVLLHVSPWWAAIPPCRLVLQLLLGCQRGFFQARRDINSLQLVPGQPQGFIPVGHSWNTFVRSIQEASFFFSFFFSFNNLICPFPTHKEQGVQRQSSSSSLEEESETSHKWNLCYFRVQN